MSIQVITVTIVYFSSRHFQEINLKPAIDVDSFGVGSAAMEGKSDF